MVRMIPPCGRASGGIVLYHSSGEVFFYFLKRLFAYYVFYAASVGLGRHRRDADYLRKEFGDEAVALVDSVGPGAPQFGKAQLAVRLHRDKTVVFQYTHRAADARFADGQFARHVYRTYGTVSVLKY